MSPRRHGLSSLLAQASLADRDLERERIRAQRDSQNFATGVGALRSLVPAAGELYNAAGKQAEADADNDVAAIMGENLTSTGDATMSAEDYAAKLTREDKRTAQAEPTDGVGRFFASLDPKTRARKAAAVKAQAGLAAQVKGNRDAVTAKAAAEATAKAKAAAEKAKLDLDVDKEAARSNLEGFKREDARGKADADRDARATEGEANRTARAGEGEADREARIKAAEIAAAARKSRGGTKALTESQLLDIEKKKLEIERMKAAVAAKEKTADEGKPMSPKDIGDLNAQRAAIKNLEDLKGLAEGQGMGVFSAAQKAVPSWLSSLKSTERVTFEKANERAIQNVAKALEGGKLTDSDSERYNRMLMDASGSKEAYMKALEDITREVSAAQSGYESGLTQSGYRVPSATAPDPQKAFLEQSAKRAARMRELKASGKSKDEAFAILRAEGLAP